MNQLVILLLTVLSLSIAAPILAAPQAATPPAQATEKATAAVAATINVNTASAAELQSLPGIGQKTAENIVAFRTEKGKFKNTRDLLKVKGIGEKTFEKIKNLVAVE